MSRIIGLESGQSWDAWVTRTRPFRDKPPKNGPIPDSRNDEGAHRCGGRLLVELSRCRRSRSLPAGQLLAQGLQRLVAGQRAAVLDCAVLRGGVRRGLAGLDLSGLGLV